MGLFVKPGQFLEGHHPGSTLLETIPAFSATDATVLAGILLITGIAWLVSEKYWPPVARALSPLAISRLAPDPPAAAEAIRRTLGARLPSISARDVLRNMAGEGILSFFQLLRSYRVGRWAPAVRTNSFERVEAALQSGRGVILGWHTDFTAIWLPRWPFERRVSASAI